MQALIRPNIQAMSGYVPGEQPTQADVVKLNTNENPYPPSPRVLEAIGGISPEMLRRYPSPDGRAFREAAARVHGISPEMILTTNGGDELLAYVIRACVGENGQVAFLEPSYSLYPVLAAMQGAKAQVWPYQIDGTSWQLPEGLGQSSAAVMVICNPNAPSGTRVDNAKLSQIAAEFRGLLLVDEAYVNFTAGSALELVARHPNLMLLRSMSKGYGLAGMRFGYGIAQEYLIRELYKIRDSYPCDVVSIAAATAAIEDQAYAAGTWQKVQSERTRLSAALREMGFSLPESHANFVLAQVPAAPRQRAAELGGGELARELYEALKRRGLLVRYFALPRLTDKLRITVGTPQQNDRLLATLQALLG